VPTPDRKFGPALEEEVQFDDRTSDGDPSIEGALRRVGNLLRYFVDSAVTQVARWKNVPAGFDDVDLTGITNGQGLAYNDTNKQFEPQTFAGGADELAKVSANDTTAGYLNGKLVAGSGVTLTEQNDGGNETLEIAAGGGQNYARHFLLMGG
jgi:hypothetical protein